MGEWVVVEAGPSIEWCEKLYERLTEAAENPEVKLQCSVRLYAGSAWSSSLTSFYRIELKRTLMPDDLGVPYKADWRRATVPCPSLPMCRRRKLLRSALEGQGLLTDFYTMTGRFDLYEEVVDVILTDSFYRIR